LDLLGVPKGI